MGATAGEPPLSLERIVATAIELLDGNGIDGLSMRRLAERLGAGAMSLYWHVDNKEEVFDLALDAVLAYRPPPSGELHDWRADTVLMLEDWRAAMLRHPWQQRRLTELSERYPSIDRSRLLLDSDWDGAFKRGLDLLLDGLTPKR